MCCRGYINLCLSTQEWYLVQILTEARHQFITYLSAVNTDNGMVADVRMRLLIKPTNQGSRNCWSQTNQRSTRMTQVTIIITAQQVLEKIDTWPRTEKWLTVCDIQSLNSAAGTKVGRGDGDQRLDRYRLGSYQHPAPHYATGRMAGNGQRL